MRMALPGSGRARIGQERLLEHCSGPREAGAANPNGKGWTRNAF